MRRWTLTACLVLAAIRLFAQSFAIEEMEFKDQPVTDILLALAQATGRSILPDDTVTGNASYYFTHTDLDQALAQFLPNRGLYYWVDEGVYYVSRVRVRYERESGLISVDAEEVRVRQIIRAISRAVSRTILYDALPDEPVSLHVAGARPEAVLSVITTRFGELSLEETPLSYYLRRRTEGSATPASAESALSRSGDLYSLAAERIRFRDAIRALFSKGGREYSLLGRNDPLLEGLHFHAKSFEEMLRLLLEQGESECSRVGEIFYIYDARKGDILKGFDSTVLVSLRYLPAAELPSLLPARLAAGEVCKVDARTNSVVLSGSIAEIAPIQRFIEAIDRPLSGKSFYRFDLSYASVDDLAKLLPEPLSVAPPIPLPHENSFVMLLSPEMKSAVEEYVRLVDSSPPSLPVRLKFIRSAELLKNLPPSVNAGDLLASSDPSVVFFRGSLEKRRRFEHDLAAVDRPVPQIKYEILVIQYQQGQKLNHEVSLANSILKAGDRTAYIGSIGRLLDLNFDVVSAFGYLFALNLNLSLSDSKARVLADTTLNGLSGQKIKFQNTDTFRYRDAFVDPETGKVNPTGVVREITSGLVIEIDGWVSGNEMITMDIHTTISKRGADANGSETALPPTTEKVIDTHVRTAAGTPVVIGGLIEHDSEEQLEKTPGLGDLPLLGAAFQRKAGSLQHTDLEVYILPHIEYPPGVGRGAWTLKELYERFARSARR